MAAKLAYSASARGPSSSANTAGGGPAELADVTGVTPTFLIELGVNVNSGFLQHTVGSVAETRPTGPRRG